MQIVIELRLNKEILQNAGMSQYPPYETCDLGYAHPLPGYEKSSWINVKDSLPDIEVMVLVTDGKLTGVAWNSSRWGFLGTNSDAIYGWNRQLNLDHVMSKPTHWMNLPELPK